MDDVESDRKLIVAIFHENYEGDNLITSLFQDAISKGIDILPIGLHKNNEFEFAKKLPSIIQPVFISIDELNNNDYAAVKNDLYNYLRKG